MSIGSAIFNAKLAESTSTLRTIYTVGAAFCVSFSVDVISEFFMTRAHRTVSNEMMREVSSEIGRRRSCDLGTREATATINKLTNRVQNSGDIGSAFVRVISSSLTLGLYAGFAMYKEISPTAIWLTGAMLTPPIALIMYNIHTMKRMDSKLAAQTSQLRTINTDLTDISKSRTAILTGSRHLLQERQKELSEIISNESLAHSKKFGALAIGTALTVGYCMTAILSHLQATAGAQTILFTGIVTSVTYRVFPLMRSLGNLAGYSEFLKILRTMRGEKKEQTSSAGQELNSPAVGLRATDITFSYEDQNQPQRRMIFNFASLEIRPSSFMALFAGEGVGKSTLFDIFATTKSPEGGKISLLDGDREVPLREINEKKWLEQYVGYAPQKPETIDGFTLEENLLTKCGMKEADRALFERLLFVFGVPDWKDILGQKLGAKGGGRVLSPGEVQRLSLIRTLMTRPKVLLLDEPFSALSQETAVNLLIAVKNLKNSGVFDYQPTTILITHDSRQAELSDEIAFIDKDTATITQGTHEYLVATQLAYQANATAFSKDNIARLEGRRLPDVATVLPQSETVP